MSRQNRRSKGDVHWFVPGRKTPVAYSTKAASDLIIALSKDGATIREVRDRITYDIEARKILNIYIEKGYGDTVASDLFS